LKVVLSPQAIKYLKQLNEPIKGRILLALKQLEQEPPLGDIKALAGQEGFRLRVGSYRILFGTKNDTIVVTNIAPRGRVYKRR